MAVENAFPWVATKQDQRVWALKNAKSVLDNRAPFGKGDEISTVDLIDLSLFILTGEDPYSEVRDRVV